MIISVKDKVAINFLCKYGDRLFDEDHSDFEREEVESFLNGLNNEISCEIAPLVFKAINISSDPYLLQMLPGVLSFFDVDIVHQEISKLILHEHYAVASEGVLLAGEFLSKNYISSIKSFLSRKDGTVDGVDIGIDIIETLERELGLKNILPEIEKIIPDWYKEVKEKKNAQIIQYRVDIILKESSQAMLSKKYKNAIKLLDPYEKYLDKNGMNKLLLAKKMNERSS